MMGHNIKWDRICALGTCKDNSCYCEPRNKNIHTLTKTSKIKTGTMNVEIKMNKGLPRTPLRTAYIMSVKGPFA